MASAGNQLRSNVSESRHGLSAHFGPQCRKGRIAPFGRMLGSLTARADGATVRAPAVLEARPGTPDPEGGTSATELLNSTNPNQPAVGLSAAHTQHGGQIMGELRQRGHIWWIRYYRDGRRFEESAKTDKYEKARDLLKETGGGRRQRRPLLPCHGSDEVRGSDDGPRDRVHRQQARFARASEAPDQAAPEAVVPRPADDQDHDGRRQRVRAASAGTEARPRRPSTASWRS